jgi:hypothetical protein
VNSDPADNMSVDKWEGVKLNVRIWSYENPDLVYQSTLDREWPTIVLYDNMNEDYLWNVVTARQSFEEWNKLGIIMLTSFDGSKFVREQLWPKPLFEDYYVPDVGVKQKIKGYVADEHTACLALKYVQVLSRKIGRSTEGRSWTLDITR